MGDVTNETRILPMAYDAELGRSNAFVCTRHLFTNIKDRLSAAEAHKYNGAVRATTEAVLKDRQEAFEEKTLTYLDKRTSCTTDMKVEVFPVKANVRGNTTTNVVEGSHAANAPARNVPTHLGVMEFNNMQRSRFFANREKAHACETWLPPKVMKIHEEMLEGAQALHGEVSIPDEANPQREARVLGFSGRSYYISNLEGDRATSDVKCSCGVPRVQGHPCVHNMKHALQLQTSTEKLFHFKDTTACWQEQYPQEDEWPSIEMESVRHNGHVDRLVRYPPLPPPKVGRPKGTKRVRAHSEDKSGDKQQKTTGRRCGQCKQPGHTKRTCPDLVGTSSRAGE